MNMVIHWHSQLQMLYISDNLGKLCDLVVVVSFSFLCTFSTVFVAACFPTWTRNTPGITQIGGEDYCFYL